MALSRHEKILCKHLATSLDLTVSVGKCVFQLIFVSLHMVSLPWRIMCTCNDIYTIFKAEHVCHAHEAGDLGDGTIIGQSGIPKQAQCWLKCHPPSDIYTDHRGNGCWHKTGHLRSSSTSTQEYRKWEPENKLVTVAALVRALHSTTQGKPREHMVADL